MIGSAPRVRGTHLPPKARRALERFSPACAGNTPRQAGATYIMAVQPRVCGEHRRPFHCTRPDCGSAPRVRGTQFEVTDWAAVDRFSPACAGNTAGDAAGDAARQVQPRVCGEHGSKVSTVKRLAGSAPRVRGTRLRHTACGVGRRFSPACAGNTLPFKLPPLYLMVQPRVCGEHERVPTMGNETDGSAPRVRGTPLGNIKAQEDKRFSPACAGNTRLRLFRSPPSTVQPRVCGEHRTRTPRLGP